MTQTVQGIVKAVSCLLMAFSVYMAVYRVDRPLPEAALPRRSARRASSPPRSLRWLGILLLALGSRAALLLLSRLVAPGALRDVWTRWDAVHYTTIMRQGYSADLGTPEGLNIVFFPLYPLLCRLLGGSFGAMLAVSWAALAGSCLLIDRACVGAERPWAVTWLCCFPVAVFLGAPYTESLFLLTTGLTILMIRRRRWALAGLFGMLAALTRNLGVLTALAFVTGYLEDFRTRVARGEAKWRQVVPAVIRGGGLWCALIPLGTLIYLGLNQAVYGDPLIFLTVQREHWSQSFGFFGQTLVTSLDYALHYPEADYRLWLFIPQTVMMALSLVTMPFLLRRMHPEEAVYSFAYFLCALSPTWLLSYPRYIMGMVTLYPALARTVKPLWARLLLTGLFAAWMIPSAIAYLQGRPVL